MSKATQQISGRIKIKTQLSASFSVWENIAVAQEIGREWASSVEREQKRKNIFL